jgi:catalase
MKYRFMIIAIGITALTAVGYWVATAKDHTVKDPQVGASKDREHLPVQLVKNLHSAFGERGVRAVHAKGVILEGEFTPTLEAKTLCKAVVFDATVSVVVRFSDFTGIPDISDTKYDASPRGFAVKFLLKDGSNLDVVSHSFNGFPTATAKEFGELFQAVGASGPEAAKPTALDKFLATHPVAKTFLTTQKPPPESYATAQYYGVNSFLFTDAKGAGRAVRYRFVPDIGEKYLDAAALKEKGPNYLAEEIRVRVDDKPIRFTWYAQLAEVGDDLENPSIAWPETRKLVKLGVLTIDRVGSNTPAADKALSFLPGTLVPGIGIADPMVTIRNAAYPISFHQRQ